MDKEATELTLLEIEEYLEEQEDIIREAQESITKVKTHVENLYNKVKKSEEATPEVVAVEETEEIDEDPVNPLQGMTVQTSTNPDSMYSEVDESEIPLGTVEHVVGNSYKIREETSWSPLKSPDEVIKWFVERDMEAPSLEELPKSE
jgi:uncharacterized coiled-coil protein SlyX